MTPGVSRKRDASWLVASCLPESSRLVARGLLLLALGAPACGGGGGSAGPTNPTAPPTTQPAAGNPVVTITSQGVDPKMVEIPVGGRVTFVNNDQAFHEMSSDPHPIHSDCPQMNEVGALAPGASRQTGAFANARSCGFHDHGQFSNTTLQGTIVIR